MHTSIIAGALFAALAMGKPVKTETVLDTETITTVVVVTSTSRLSIPTPVVPVVTVTKSASVVKVSQTPKVGSTTVPASSLKPGAAVTPVAKLSVEVPVHVKAVSSPPVVASGSGPDSTDWRGVALFHHNQHRANHSADALQWDNALEESARIAAEGCVFGHQMQINGGGYGQNIANGFPADKISGTITTQFYNEVVKYPNSYGSEPSMAEFETWGHFSQIVWKSTTKVGCFVAKCSNQAGGAYTVCNYSPPGNVTFSFNPIA